MNIIQQKVEQALQQYTKGKFYEDLKLAKVAYISKTGKIDEESEEYESRMNSFNDWYIFNYKNDNGQKIIEQFIDENILDDDIKEALSNTTYSLFLFHKKNFRKQIIIKDVLHSTKHILSKENGLLALVEDDLFIGRIVCYKEEFYLLNGLCTLPREILSALKKESKKVRKLNNIEEEEQFLLNLERLKTRSLQYGHIESSQIFTF